MQRCGYRLVLALLALSLATGELRAEPWPADAGEEVGRSGEGDGLPPGLEPSGAVWHPRLELLLVVDDNGFIIPHDPDTGNSDFWYVDHDLEAVAIADPRSSLIYLGLEHPDAVLEFDIELGEFTGRTWNLTPWMTGPDDRGLEALTFADGLFYAGLQADGKIYVFSLEDGDNVKHRETIPGARDSDLSGLHFDAATRTLLAIYDEHDVLVEMSPSGDVVREYDLPGKAQEGVALLPHCEAGSDEATLFIAGDDGGELWRYRGYPWSCPGLGTEWILGLASLALVIALASLHYWRRSRKLR
ncbi:MAG: hypothetical protein GY725_02885 [bacterium]|nr:hypothetical protein [bacterium]